MKKTIVSVMVEECYLSVSVLLLGGFFTKIELDNVHESILKNITLSTNI